MEYTEPKTAEMLAKNKTEIANIESNNGGRGFARNVERILREMNITRTTISCFTQTANKQVRIFTKSADVNNITYFPTGWDKRWPEFYRAITGYMKEGGNANDDAPDALTGCYEKRSTPLRDDDLNDINIW
jgi:predicted phage terminase large subunit-like protein